MDSNNYLRQSFIQWEFSPESDPVWAYEQDIIDLTHKTLFTNSNRKLRIGEICCCAGHFCYETAKKYKNFNVIGIDNVNEILNRARNNFSLNNLQFIYSKLDKFSFESSIFDYIICRYWFHHLFNIESFTKEVRRVLRRKAKFCIIDIFPENDEVYRNLNDIYKNVESKISAFNQLYTLECLKSIICNNGFSFESHLPYEYKKKLILPQFVEEFRNVSSFVKKELNVKINENSVDIVLPAAIMVFTKN